MQKSLFIQSRIESQSDQRYEAQNDRAGELVKGVQNQKKLKSSKKTETNWGKAENSRVQGVSYTISQ